MGEVCAAAKLTVAFKYFIKFLVQYLLNILRENRVVTLRVLPVRRKLNNLEDFDGGNFISIILIDIKSGNLTKYF